MYCGLHCTVHICLNCTGACIVAYTVLCIYSGLRCTDACIWCIYVHCMCSMNLLNVACLCVVQVHEQQFDVFIHAALVRHTYSCIEMCLYMLH